MHDRIPIVARLAAAFAGVALLLACDGSESRTASYSSSYTSTDPATTPVESNEELETAVAKFEAARDKLAELAFDDAKRASYVAALDDELARRNYDFEGVLDGERESREHFRDMLLAACRTRGIIPPHNLWELGPPFDEAKANIDWGSSNRQLPEAVRQWIAEKGKAIDPVRDEYDQVKGTGMVAKKILEVSALRESLQERRSKTQELRRRFTSDMGQLENEIAMERAKLHPATDEAALANPLIRNDISLLLDKRAYVRYLEETAARLEAATTDLLFVERKSRDDFRMKRLVGGEATRELMGSIDAVLARYHDDALDRKLDAAASESPQDVLHMIKSVDPLQ